MNNSVLLESEYQRQIRQNIENIGEINKDSNPNTLQELIKGAIRNVTIKYTRAIKKKENEKEKQPQKDILNIEKKKTIRNKRPTGIGEYQSLNEKKSELNGLIDHNINEILIRSKANKIEFNKKNILLVWKMPIRK